jgi:GNAT superfamily N-acetyltransferase
MAEINLRSANSADAPALAELRYIFRSTYGIATEPKERFLERCRVWMTEHLQEETLWRCWLAETNQRIIGAIWLQLVEKIPNPRAEAEFHAYITNFYLEEAARGRGLGSRLLEMALDWCREREIHAVILWPTEKSRPLYERYGFGVREDILELVLADAESVKL